MLIDEAQAVELTRREARNALSHQVVVGGTMFIGGVRLTRRLLQS